MPEDVGYCRTSLIYGVFSFSIIFCFSCHYFCISILPGISAEYYSYE